MRVAAWQFDVRRDEVEANLAAVERGLEAAARDGAQLLVLPEMWPTSFSDAGGDARAVLEESERALERLRQRTAELGLAVCGSAYGRVEEADEHEPPANRLHLIDRGEHLLAYDKVHLFTPTAEHEGFTPGEAPPPTVDSRFGRVAGLVCYDVRFPEIVRTTFRDGVELLLVCAQWPTPRAAHWRVLLTARAVETQCFVVAANRTGSDRIGRRRLELAFPGNSLIADPHGSVLAEGRGGEELVAADVDLEVSRALRVRVPIAKDARPDLYRRWSAPDTRGGSG